MERVDGEEDGVGVLGTFLVLTSDALSVVGAEGFFRFLFDDDDDDDGGGAEFFLLFLMLLPLLPFPFAFGVSGVTPAARRGETRLLVPVLVVVVRRSAVGVGV